MSSAEDKAALARANRARINAKSRERYAADPGYKRQLAESKRALRARNVAKGLRYDGKPRAHVVAQGPTLRTRLRRLVHRLQTWRRNASPEIRGAICISQGKPWNDPRLTDAESLRMRYAMDPSFHEREYQRLQQRKRIRRQQEAALRVDLTVTQERRLRAAATHCSYCGEELTSESRTLDHVVPLSKGGPHSTDNVVPACRSCNSRLQDKARTTAHAAPP